MPGSGVARLAAAQGKNMATFDGTSGVPKGGRVKSPPSPRKQEGKKKEKKGGY